MSDPHHPHRGSMQFWPRKKAKCSLARIKSWAAENKVKPLGFIGFKAGMTHVMAVDNRKKSLSKGEKICLSATIIECPPMTVFGIVFYKKNIFGTRKVGSIYAEKMAPELGRKIQLSKKQAKTIADIPEFDDLRLLVHSNPKLTLIGAKKPKLLEVVLGGNKEDKLIYAKNILGKEIMINDVFEAGNNVDVHGITKGKGYQGPVKRFGIPIRQHKAEKTKRGPASLGPWKSQGKIMYRVAHAGQMGFHLRTEYNKQILKVGEEGSEITPKGGLGNYGILKNQYVLLKGSTLGPKKRSIVLTQGIRPTRKTLVERPELTYISK